MHKSALPACLCPDLMWFQVLLQLYLWPGLSDHIRTTAAAGTIAVHAHLLIKFGVLTEQHGGRAS